MVDQFGTYQVTFIFAGVMMCIGGISAIIARCIHRESEDPGQLVEEENEETPEAR